MNKLLMGILTYNRLEFTKKCLDSLFENTNEEDFELVIIDNGSTDGTKEYLDSFFKEKKHNVDVFYSDKNLGVAGGLNKILTYRKQDQHFMKLDNDIVFKKDTNKNWVKTIDAIFNADIRIETQEGATARIGAICLKPYTWDEKQNKEINLVQEYPEVEAGPLKFQYNPEGVLGCSTIFRSEIFDFFKHFDEDFIYGYEESLLHVEMIKHRYVSFFSNQIVRVYHIDPGGDTEYIKWKHEQAKNNYNLYIKKYEELTK